MRALAALACVLSLALVAGEDSWDKENGKPAPALVGAAWLGTPVAIDQVKGNTVVLAFWNADIAC